MAFFQASAKTPTFKFKRCIFHYEAKVTEGSQNWDPLARLPKVLLSNWSLKLIFSSKQSIRVGQPIKSPIQANADDG